MNKPKSMHADWAVMRDETLWDKTDGVSELRGRLDRIREGFESAAEAPRTHEEKLAELRASAVAQKASCETEYAAIDEAIATLRKPRFPGQHNPNETKQEEKNT